MFNCVQRAKKRDKKPKNVLKSMFKYVQGMFKCVQNGLKVILVFMPLDPIGTAYVARSDIGSLLCSFSLKVKTD